MSARILNELAGQRRPEELWRWVILSVAVGGVLALLNAVLLRVKSAQRDLFYDSKELAYKDDVMTLAQIPVLEEAPESPVAGQMYFQVITGA